MPTSSTADTTAQSTEVCPICGGVGFLRRDLPIGDPDFGKLVPCICRQNETNQAARYRLYQLSNLEAFKTMSFASFSVQGRLGLADEQIRSLQYALSQAQQFAANPHGWLLLMGSYGCGKTHLAAAVANTCVEFGMQTIFLTVPDLLDWLRYSYDATDDTFERRFEELKNISLLVLDDLGAHNSTSWAAEKLFQIMDYRYIRKLPTVITSNLELEDLDDRVRSRLQDPDLVTNVRISAPDYRSPVKDRRDPLQYQLHLLSDRSFGNFSLREPENLTSEVQLNLEKVFRAAQEFAEHPHGWLVMTGTYGCGKTHLAAAVGNYRKGMGDSPVFVVVPDLLDHLRATFSPTSSTSYDDLFNRVKSAPILILDDLGTQSATPWAREKLYQIFNERYNAKLPTVITMSSNLEDLDARIRSRMLDTRVCRIYEIIAPSYRGSSPKPVRARRK
ncbi:MAG: ATP-binding protein [Anaerolineaceae bacterium]|jgi:DNA replication protein DnaC